MLGDREPATRVVSDREVAVGIDPHGVSGESTNRSHRHRAVHGMPMTTATTPLPSWPESSDSGSVATTASPSSPASTATQAAAALRLAARGSFT